MFAAVPVPLVGGLWVGVGLSLALSPPGVIQGDISRCLGVLCKGLNVGAFIDRFNPVSYK